jgi:hypothetical protein
VQSVKVMRKCLDITEIQLKIEDPLIIWTFFNFFIVINAIDSYIYDQDSNKDNSWGNCQWKLIPLLYTGLYTVNQIYLRFWKFRERFSTPSSLWIFLDTTIFWLNCKNCSLGTSLSQRDESWNSKNSCE